MAKSKKYKKRHSSDVANYVPSEQLIAYFNTAERKYADANYSEAAEAYQEIFRADKRFAPALRQLGICQLHLGDTVHAIRNLSKYIKSVSDDQQAYAFLSQAYRFEQQLTKARHQISIALKLGPTADLHFLAASIEEELHSVEKAIVHYNNGLQLEPNRVSAQLALGVLHKNIGNYRCAIQIFERILEVDPDNHNALTNLGTVFHAIGLYEQAISYYAMAFKASENADIAYNQGLSYQQLAKPMQSIESFERSLELNSRHVDAKVQLAETMSTQGHFLPATALLDQVLKEDEKHVLAWYLKTQYRKFEQIDSKEEWQLSRLSRNSKSEDDNCLIHFGLAKIYDDTKRYARAFEHLTIANASKNSRLKESAEQQIQTLITPSLDLNGITDPSLPSTTTPRPIFVVGMPRSGTTLLERVICTSPEIAACGEVDYFGPALFRYQLKIGEFVDSGKESTPTASELIRIREGYLKRIKPLVEGHAYFVDKTPDNFRFLPLIRALFPNAFVIHSVRNPLDVCLSIYAQFFQNLAYSYDLTNIAKYYLGYLAIIRRQHNAPTLRWLDVSYESTVTDTEAIKARLSDFLAVNLESKDGTETSLGVINTASKWQARQMIYQASINRWHLYEGYLGELKTILKPVLAK